MTFDELSLRFDGIIPWEEKEIDFYGSYHAYGKAFLDTASHNFGKRCVHTIQASCAWRVSPRRRAPSSAASSMSGSRAGQGVKGGRS